MHDMVARMGLKNKHKWMNFQHAYGGHTSMIWWLECGWTKWDYTAKTRSISGACVVAIHCCVGGHTYNLKRVLITLEL